MNPTWRKKCRIASPSGFCECFWTHEKKMQTTQTRLRRSNASHNLSRYVLLTRACRSRPLLRAFSPRLRGLCSFPNKAGDDRNSAISKSIQKWIANTPAHSHTLRAFCRICIFANTSEFSKISADDQNPSAHTYPIFFLMQRSISVFAINPPQKSNAFLPPGGRNTRPIVLSVFFF